MWLVICDPNDSAALWAYAGLRERGLSPLVLITPHELACSTWSEHRIGCNEVTFEIAVPGGQKLVSSDIRGVLNRLSELPVEHLVFSSEEETRYVIQEWNALILSWMTCIGAVSINKASPRGLAGAWRSPAERNALAARARLPVAPLTLSSGYEAELTHPSEAERAVMVLGGRVFGDEVQPRIAEACVQLAALAETTLLGIYFSFEQGGLLFRTADPLPDLRIGGLDFFDHLHVCLTRQAMQAP